MPYQGEGDSAQDVGRRAGGPKLRGDPVYEKPRTPLRMARWWRLVIDEAQAIFILFNYYTIVLRTQVIYGMTKAQFLQSLYCVVLLK